MEEKEGVVEEPGACESHSCLKRVGEVQESSNPLLLLVESLCVEGLSSTLEELTPFSVVEPGGEREYTMNTLQYKT